MITFSEWVYEDDLTSISEWLNQEFNWSYLFEGLAGWSISELPAEIALTVDKVLQSASQPLTSSGSPSWLHSNYLHWLKNKEELKQRLFDLFQKPGIKQPRPTPETSTRGNLRKTLRDLCISIFQKSANDGPTRRNFGYALHKKVQDPHLALHGDTPDSTAMPGVNPLKNGRGMAWTKHPIIGAIRYATAIANKGTYNNQGAAIANKKQQKLWSMYSDYLKLNKDHFISSNDPIPDFQAWLDNTQLRKVI